jgi:Cu/Ag efflux protein CusF
MKRSMHTALWRYGAILAVTTACAQAGAQRPDPTIPGPADAGLKTKTVLPVEADNYLRRIDEPRLPWPGLYNPDGSFVRESNFNGSTAPAHVQTPASAMGKHVMMASPRRGDARGVVRKVNTAQSKITLKHGPIQKYDMPGMTMSFRAKDPVLLNGLKPGDEVDFDVLIEGTKFFVTGIRKPSQVQAPASTMGKHAMTPPPRRGNARGLVRKVDTAQGKVTLKHGPIQNLDMPGMTMSFRAKDPELLKGLKPGDEVDFDVVIEGTKFFITGIRK